MYDQPFNPYVKNLNAVKDYYKSPFTLVYGIAQILAGILSLISAILISANFKDIISYFKEYVLDLLDKANGSNGLKSDVARIFDEINDSGISSSVFSSMPSLIITGLAAAAILIIFFKSRNKDPRSTPMTGFTILYVFAIISLVGVILAAVGVALIIALLFWVYASLVNSTSTRISAALDLDDIPLIRDFLRDNPDLDTISSAVLLAVVIVLTAVAVIALFFALFTAINRVRYYKSVRSSLSSVDLQSKGAKPYGVMCVLGTVSVGMSLISSFSVLFLPKVNGKTNPMVGVGIVCILALIASFVSRFAEAKLALGYKTYIDNVKYGYNTPAAPAAPYTPYGPAGGYYAPQNQPQSDLSARPAPTSVRDKPILFGFGIGDDMSADNAYADPYGADQPDKAAPEAPAISASDAEEITADEVVEAIPDAAEPEPEAAEPDLFSEEPQAEPAAVEEPEEPAAAPVCPVCGAETVSGAPFCGNCGNRL